MKQFIAIIFIFFIVCFVSSQNTSDYAFKFLKTEISDQPVYLKFHWIPFSNISGIKIFRKLSTASSYSQIALLAGSDTVFTDSELTQGLVYDYSFESINASNTVIARSFINGGVNKPEINYRGKVLLLIDSAYTTSLSLEITRLISDIEGDGWQVIRKSILRSSPVNEVKNLVKSEYIKDPQNLKCVFLLGHLPVPYSGNINPDGHSDHKGAWPSDGFYADMDGIWTDEYVTNSTASDSRLHNIPGDGKFDQSQFPSDLELEIGRVDLFNLPEFPISDTELLRQYLTKNHNYRNKKVSIEQKAIMTDIFGMLGNEYPAASGWRTFTAMIPYNNIKVGDYRSLTRANPTGFIWGYGCGPGDYSSVGLVTHSMYFASEPHGATFNLLFGSYFGDWDTKNNVMRSCIASSGSALTCNWSARPFSVLHHMAFGETIGYSMKVSMNNYFNYPSNSYATLFYRMVHDGLMGDPTVRMHVVAPPENVEFSGSNNNYTINWVKCNENEIAGYNVFVYDNLNEKFSKLNSGYITETSYHDYNTYTTQPRYMVKSVKKEFTNSGSYYNQSQGITANLATSNNDIRISGLTIIPHLSDNRTFSLNLNTIDKFTHFEIVDINSKTILLRKISNSTETFQLNADLTSGVYILRVYESAGNFKSIKFFLE